MLLNNKRTHLMAWLCSLAVAEFGINTICQSDDPPEDGPETTTIRPPGVLSVGGTIMQQPLLPFPHETSYIIQICQEYKSNYQSYRRPYRTEPKKLTDH